MGLATTDSANGVSATSGAGAGTAAAGIWGGTSASGDDCVTIEETALLVPIGVETASEGVDCGGVSLEVDDGVSSERGAGVSLEVGGGGGGSGGGGEEEDGDGSAAGLVCIDCAS